MLVSNFTLGFNNYGQFPTGWTSDYELQVTNLASIEITFDVEWRVTYHYFGGVDEAKESVPTSLNKMLWRTWRKDAHGYYAHDSQLIGPNESRKFNLGPWLYQGRDWTPYVDGYAVLRVPVVRGPQPPYPMVPQSKTVIPVLLNAVRSETWIRGRPGSPDLVTNSQSSFPLASGKALNELAPETSPYVHPMSFRDYMQAVIAGKISPARGALDLPEEDRAQAVLDLLNQLTNDESEFEALNSWLRDSGSAVRIVGADSESGS